MKHLPLVGTRHGKRVVRWPLLLVRFAVYLLVFGSVVYLVTWLYDWTFHREDHRNVIRLIALSFLLSAFFVVHDVRRDSTLPSNSLPDLDHGSHPGPK